MPRHARVSGLFQHVIVRGINKQILFEDDFDRSYYLSLLGRFKQETGIEILAYCLMDNHVHILLKDDAGAAPDFMKKIGISYATYFNRKYDRSGHLFQDRYKNENVTDDAYLLAVFRYILKNPEKTGVAWDAYIWSSHADYGKADALTQTALLASIIGSKESFYLFMTKNDKAEFMEYSPEKTRTHNDKWALSVIKKVHGNSDGIDIQKLPKPQRDAAIARLKQNGISVRQLERLTGINRGAIQRA